MSLPKAPTPSGITDISSRQGGKTFAKQFRRGLHYLEAQGTHNLLSISTYKLGWIGTALLTLKEVICGMYTHINIYTYVYRDTASRSRLYVPERAL